MVKLRKTTLEQTRQSIARENIRKIHGVQNIKRIVKSKCRTISSRRARRRKLKRQLIHNTPNPTGRPMLLEIPTELRVQIYQLVFGTESSLVEVGSQIKHNHIEYCHIRHSLLQVSRKIRAEALTCFQIQVHLNYNYLPKYGSYLRQHELRFPSTFRRAVTSITVQQPFVILKQALLKRIFPELKTVSIGLEEILIPTITGKISSGEYTNEVACEVEDLPSLDDVQLGIHGGVSKSSLIPKLDNLFGTHLFPSRGKRGHDLIWRTVVKFVQPRGAPRDQKLKSLKVNVSLNYDKHHNIKISAVRPATQDHIVHPGVHTLVAFTVNDEAVHYYPERALCWTASGHRIRV